MKTPLPEAEELLSYLKKEIWQNTRESQMLAQDKMPVSFGLFEEYYNSDPNWPMGGLGKLDAGSKSTISNL